MVDLFAKVCNCFVCKTEPVIEVEVGLNVDGAYFVVL